MSSRDLDLDPSLTSTSTPCPLPSLDVSNFDATPAFSNYQSPPGARSVVQRLENASREGNLLAVKEAFAELRSLWQGRGDDMHTGRTLLWAIEQEHQDIVAYLLSEDVPPLSHVVRQATLTKNTAILQLLFETAWDINQALGWEDPPALACAVTDLDLTAWFLAYGADPNASSIMEETPLSTAVRDAPFPVIQMLFAHSGNVNQGHLLHSAVWRKLDDRKTVMEFLIRKGAPVNAVMYEDRPELYLIRKPFGLGTPLHTAAATGHEDVLQVLISHGARLDFKDSCGDLAVEVAEAEGYSSAAQHLRDQAARDCISIARRCQHPIGCS